MKTKKIIHLARTVILGYVTVMALVFMFAPSSVQQTSPPTAQLTPTLPIDKQRSTGGTTAENTEPSAESNDSTSTTSDSDTSEQSDATEIVSDNAPKQTTIKDSISVERTYRAFALPNDPYAQNAAIFNYTTAPAAWDITTGSEVIVANIDTGYALNHEDLRDAWYINANEQGMTTSGDTCWTGTPANKSTNNCDDDSNGYIDDWRGWNFVAIDNNPQAGRQNANGGAVSHGTETAGLVGAVTNNGVGIASHNWHTKIMPLQALSDDGAGYTSSVVAAMYYAVDNGAAVINLSLGTYEHDPYVDEAVQYAYDNNVVVVAAAGNCGTGQEYGCNPDRPGAIAYPALNPHVIAVGAIDDDKVRASFSSYGPALDVMAPGDGSITSTMWLPDNETSAYSVNLHGTSFAAPIVSSLVSLLRSQRPNSSVDDITALIDGTAQKVTGLAGRNYNTTYGHGLINSATAIIVAQALGESSAIPILAQTGSEHSEHSFTSSSLLSSGCSTSAPAYCTVWAQNTQRYDRYLPYQLTSPKTGWQWNGSSLGSGEWRLRARSGDNITPETYFLFQK